MASIEIPLVPSLGSYRFGTVVETTAYLFDVRWNARSDSGRGAWYMDVYEADETPIIAGVKLVLGVYLGRRSSHSLFKNGVFIMVDRSNAGLDAGFDDLGVRVALQYIPVLDLIQRLNDAQQATP